MPILANIKGFLPQNSAMQFDNTSKIGLCNAIANYLKENGLRTQEDFSKYLRGLSRAKKVIVGAQILEAYDTGRQYGLKEAFSKLAPKDRLCNLVDTVTWAARYEIYHSMEHAFHSSENSHKFIRLLEKNLASGKFRNGGEDDESAYVYPLESEDGEPEDDYGIGAL
jgi:hypothetical protein